MNALSPQSFQAIAEFFQRVSGIRLVESKHALVQGRLQKLAMECGEGDINHFVTQVVRREVPDQVLVSVIDRLTTNETYFFREPQHFEDLALRVQDAAHLNEFNVWSGASSSGEEAHSIAMLLADKRPRLPWRIFGTDLSTAMVESARKGLYPQERARQLPADYMKRYCLRGEGPFEGQLLIQRELRQRIIFLHGNLMEDLPKELPMFDVIFLRNVLIYFDAPSKASIVRRVITKLKPEGVLYTGHAESLSSLDLPLRLLKTAVYAHA